jgi:ribosomal protein L10
MTKDEKIQEIASLKDKIGRARQVMVTDHTGINVEEMTILRRKLRAAKSEMRVSKNTLLKIAVQGSQYEILVKYFDGPTSVIIGYDDPSVPAKIIYDAIKETERPKFKALFLDGQVYGVKDLKAIAELPTKPQAISILISTVEGPIQQFIMVLDAAAREFIGTLDALAEKRKE